MRCAISLLIFLIFWSFWCFEVESRKVTQDKKPSASKPKPQSSKPEKSWVRSKIDSAKDKYHKVKDKAKEKYQSAKEKVKNVIKSDGKKKEKKQDHNPPPPPPPNRYQQPAQNPNYSPIASRKDHHSPIPSAPNLPKNVPNRQEYPPNPYPQYPPLQNNGQVLTTKKPSLLQRAKNKVKEGHYVEKGVAWVKKDLGIGVIGPKKPSKIKKFGKKAVDWMFKKKTRKITSKTGTSSLTAVNSEVSGGGGFQMSEPSSNEYDQRAGENNGGFSSLSSRIQEKMEFIQEQVEVLQNEIQDASWNTSEAGTKYKLFIDEPKNWDDALENCVHFGSKLAYLDSTSKNEYASALLRHYNITLAWFGLRTDISTGNAKPEEFPNFSNLNGCGVVDQSGVWSISTCSMELPYICQAIRLNVYVEIPPADEK